MRRIIAGLPPKELQTAPNQWFLHRLINGRRLEEFKIVGPGGVRFGYEDPVHGQEILNGINGFSPDGKVRLSPDAGDPTRIGGWKFEFHCPKAANVLFGLTDQKWKIQDIHWRGDAASTSFIDTRIWEKAQIETLNDPRLVMFVRHDNLSSCLNPQLTSTVVVLNVARDANGLEASFTEAKLFGLSRLLSAVYQETVARALNTEFGLPVILRGEDLQISGIPEEVLREFTPTGKNLEEENRPRDAQIVNSWHARAEALGWGPKEASEFISYHQAYKERCRSEQLEKGEPREEKRWTTYVQESSQSNGIDNSDSESHSHSQSH
jgi:hypothetical protein